VLALAAQFRFFGAQVLVCCNCDSLWRVFCCFPSGLVNVASLGLKNPCQSSVQLQQLDNREQMLRTKVPRRAASARVENGLRSLCQVVTSGKAKSRARTRVANWIQSYSEPNLFEWHNRAITKNCARYIDHMMLILGQEVNNLMP
jgi:uncharacterized protein YbdZ (MbtH family)